MSAEPRTGPTCKPATTRFTRGSCQNLYVPGDITYCGIERPQPIAVDAIYEDVVVSLTMTIIFPRFNRLPPYRQFDLLASEPPDHM